MASSRDDVLCKDASPVAMPVGCISVKGIMPGWEGEVWIIALFTAASQR